MSTLSPEAVEAHFEQFKDMMSLKPGWNDHRPGEGTHAPTLETWNRAVALAKRLVLAVQEEGGRAPPLPDLVPCGSGAIDIDWDEDKDASRFALVAAVPERGSRKDKVAYYGHSGTMPLPHLHERPRDETKGDDLESDAGFREVAEWLRRRTEALP